MIPDTLEEEILCVRREVRMRERMYLRWVASGLMRPQDAESEIRVMRSILCRLERLRDFGEPEGSFW